MFKVLLSSVSIANFEQVNAGKVVRISLQNALRSFACLDFDVLWLSFNSEYETIVKIWNLSLRKMWINVKCVFLKMFLQIYFSANIYFLITWSNLQEVTYNENDTEKIWLKTVKTNKVLPSNNG